MQNTLNLMKRKPDNERGSFIEYLGEVLYRAFKRFADLLAKIIKRIIKEVWHNA